MPSPPRKKTSPSSVATAVTAGTIYSMITAFGMDDGTLKRILLVLSPALSILVNLYFDAALAGAKLWLARMSEKKLLNNVISDAKTAMSHPNSTEETRRIAEASINNALLANLHSSVTNHNRATGISNSATDLTNNKNENKG